LGGTNDTEVSVSLSMYHLPLDSVDESPGAPPVAGDLPPLSVLNVGFPLLDLTYCPDFDTLFMIEDNGGFNILHASSTPLLGGGASHNETDLTTLEFTQRWSVLNVHCASLPTLPHATTGFFAGVLAGTTGTDLGLMFIDSTGDVLLPEVLLPSGLDAVSKIVTTPVGEDFSNGTHTSGTIRVAILDSVSHTSIEGTIDWEQSLSDGSVSMAPSSEWRTVLVTSSLSTTLRLPTAVALAPPSYALESQATTSSTSGRSAVLLCLVPWSPSSST
jgi:hypothetical protein